MSEKSGNYEKRDTEGAIASHPNHPVLVRGSKIVEVHEQTPWGNWGDTWPLLLLLLRVDKAV